MKKMSALLWQHRWTLSMQATLLVTAFAAIAARAWSAEFGQWSYVFASLSK